MNATLGHLVIAILLLAGGEAFRRTATFEDALAAAEERLTTQNEADTTAPEDVGLTPPPVASLPVVGPRIMADLRRQRALAAYWRSDYGSVKTPEPEGPPADGGLRLIAANAMLRDLARQPRDNRVLARSLDAVLKAYVSVLEADPNAVDAAYNYEFVSRLRGAAAAGRANSLKLLPKSSAQGEKGDPPTETKPNEFNIIVPLRPEERQEQIDPQAGAAPQRKG